VWQSGGQYPRIDHHCRSLSHPPHSQHRTSSSLPREAHPHSCNDRCRASPATQSDARRPLAPKTRGVLVSWAKRATSSGNSKNARPGGVLVVKRRCSRRRRRPTTLAPQWIARSDKAKAAHRRGRTMRGQLSRSCPIAGAQCGLGLVLRGVAERRRKAYADRPLCAVAIQSNHLWPPPTDGLGSLHRSSSTTGC